MTNAPPTQDQRGNPLAAEQALAIAQTDAVRAYRDLSGYWIRISLEGDGWHIDYELKDPWLKGGGPRYVIDPVAGSITFKTYEQ